MAQSLCVVEAAVVDLDRKLVIIHPPKTGGQALQKALGLGVGKQGNPRGLRRHDTLGEVLEKVPEAREDGWRWFILVRNPFARMVSLYHYHTQTEHPYEGPARQYVQSFIDCRQFLEYADFRHLSAAEQPFWKDVLCEPCSYYGRVAGEYARALVPLRCECLAGDAVYHFDLTDVPVHNASEHDPWPTYYHEYSAHRVAEYMREDFLRYGYATDYHKGVA